ncbi:MAG: glutaredoxin 3 [Candidatus Dadabacteria bacterium]|nr:glutaredoxin 3 [Candidatus Dadabacteria bacterium]
MIKVEIYTSTYCAYCYAAKALLNKKGVEFTEINLSRDPELRIKLVEKHNWRTVPIIVINENLIGGYEELVELERRGELDQLLSVEIPD